MRATALLLGFLQKMLASAALMGQTQSVSSGVLPAPPLLKGNIRLCCFYYVLILTVPSLSLIASLVSIPPRMWHADMPEMYKYSLSGCVWH